MARFLLELFANGNCDFVNRGARICVAITFNSFDYIIGIQVVDSSKNNIFSKKSYTPGKINKKNEIIFWITSNQKISFHFIQSVFLPTYRINKVSYTLHNSNSFFVVERFKTPKPDKNSYITSFQSKACEFHKL